MKSEEMKILITGGSEGIGKGLATRFLRAGAWVLVTGRNFDKLKKLSEDNPATFCLRDSIFKVDQ